jgi:predicted AlkP superfamily pyrophosphatase or phosphodiesterase
LAESQAEYYRFPEYIQELPPLSAYVDAVDASDGTMDGAWMGHPFEEMRGGFHTPARIPYQQRAIEEVVIREGFGADDDATDLLFVNSKLIDEVGHEFTASGEEMGVAVAAQDTGLPDMVDLLNRAVGEGRWAMLITADHGHTAHPDVTGGFRVKIRTMEELFVDLFDDEETVQRVRTSWMFVDRDRLAERGATLDDLAAFVNDMTEADLANDPSTLTKAEQAKHPFADAISVDEVNGADGG